MNKSLVGGGVIVVVLLMASAVLGETPGQESKEQVAGGEPVAQEPVAVVTVSADEKTRGVEAFAKVYEVLQHPRCMNCHPVGDAPLQTDNSKPHAMNITRRSYESGLMCSTCHQEQNSDEMGIKGGPPGAPHWQLPEKEMPLIFQGRTQVQLCEQLKDPTQNGERTLAQLLHHVSHDPLVLWGWTPGSGRTTPPGSHEDFVKQFNVWVEAGAPCQ